MDIVASAINLRPLSSLPLSISLSFFSHTHTYTRLHKESKELTEVLELAAAHFLNCYFSYAWSSRDVSHSLGSLSKAMSLLKDPKLCMQTQSNHDKLSDAMTCNSTQWH